MQRQYCRPAAVGKGRPGNAPPEPARRSNAMRSLGRFGQFLGLALPGLAILLELNRSITLGQMLVMLVAAVCCFGIGRILEGYAPP